MTLSTFKPHCLILILIFSYFCTSAQYPPAQGPAPITGNQVRELPVTLITNYISSTLKDSIIPKINRDLDSSNLLVNAKLTLSALTLKQPRLSQTRYRDQPNQKIVIIPYRIDFYLKLNNLPNRHIFQNIEIIVSCKDWYVTTGGLLEFELDGQKPYLGGTSYTESFVNFFVGFLSPEISKQISARLPDAFRKRINIALDTRCNCLGVLSDPDPGHVFSSVQFQFKQSPIHNSSGSANNIDVSILSIKRLKAANYETGTILYEPSENIYLEFFAGQKSQAFVQQEMHEEQEIIFPENHMIVPRPMSNESLVLIASIKQGDYHKDAKFVVYKSTSNFGNGTRKIVIQKVFISKPRRLPNGQMSKPKEIYINAYELTVVIKAEIPVSH